MEEIVEERSLPMFLYGQLVRERALLRRLASKHGADVVDAVDVAIEPTGKPNRWEMVFRGETDDDNRFRVVLPIRRRGVSRWTMAEPRLFVNEVENEEFGDTLEEALAAALGSSNGKVGETQGAQATNSRGARSNAVETRQQTVIRV